jgi:hypothetical protein
VGARLGRCRRYWVDRVVAQPDPWRVHLGKIGGCSQIVSADNEEETMPKWDKIFNQVSNPKDALPVNEITPELYKTSKPTDKLQQLQDERTETVQFEYQAPLWTENLATCHAVCMYGVFHVKTTAMLIGHFSNMGWAGLAGPIKMMWKKMEEMCKSDRSDGITGIYIIGGQPMNALVLNQLESHHLDDSVKSLIKCVLSPLTTDKGGRAGVIMYKNRIEWCVYSQVKEQTTPPSPRSLQSSDTVEELVPAGTNQPRPVHRNRCNIL